MSETILLLLAVIFLPVFPLSMVFNAVLDKTPHCWMKVIVIIVWPLVGLYIVLNNQFELPDWLIPLALFTSVLYALRMLSLREVNQWTGFLATSTWTLLWLVVEQNSVSTQLYGYAISMTIPLAILIILSKGLEDRFGAAYTELYGGLARTVPRFAGILVVAAVAAVATPLFPTFFFMFDLVVKTVPFNLYATAALLLTWLLWSWAGARLIQGLIVGRASKVKIVDMEMYSVFLYGMVIFALMFYGLHLGGVIL